MKLKAQAVPYSSVVGGGLTLVDENGRARFIIVAMGTTEGINKEENAAIFAVLRDAINKSGVEVPDRARTDA